MNLRRALLANVHEYRLCSERRPARTSNAANLGFLAMWLIVSSAVFAQGVEIDILHASEITRDRSVVEGQRLIGDVRLLVEEATVHCDSAWRYANGAFRLMGSVEVVDDMVRISGDQLLLNPEAGTGAMTGDEVRLVDSTNPVNHRILSTEKTTYWFREGMASFEGGGVLTQGNEEVKSERGTYQSDGGAMQFMGRVIMTLDTLTVLSEKVIYRPEDDVLELPVPARIDYPSGGAEGQRGQMALSDRSGWFAGGDSVQAQWMEGDLRVVADSLWLGDSTGTAHGRVAIFDALETYVLTGEHARMEGLQSSDSTTSIWLTGQGVAQWNSGDRPLEVHGPSLFIQMTPESRSMLASEGAVLYQEDMTAAAARLVWDEAVGRADLEGDPVLWSGEDQLSGDTIRLLLSEGEPEALQVRGHAFVSSPAQGGWHNQMAGRDLNGRFENGRLVSLGILGNGRTLYFADPDSTEGGEAEGDSLLFSLPKANRAECTEIRMVLDSVGLTSIVLLEAPSGQFADLSSLSKEPLDGATDAAHLPGFQWRERPWKARPWPVLGHPSPMLTVPEWTAPPDSLLPEGEDPIEYASKDSIVFHVRDERVALHGAAEVATAGIELTAARIDYWASSRAIDANAVPDSVGEPMGNPVFTQGGKSFTQESLRYDLDSRKGISRQAVTKEGELTFHAERAKRFPDGRIFLRGGMFSTCDAPNPHFHFHLTRGLLVPNEKVVSGPLFVKVRKVPLPLGLPFFWFPQKQERSRGILFPSFGNGQELGYFLKDLGWYEPLGEHWDARILGDIYSRGTWRLSGTTQYRYRYRFNGNFQISRSSIVSGGTAGDPGASRRTEFFVRWSHNQDPKARPNGRFNANVNFGSSGNFRSQLNSTQEDFLSNTFSSSINYNASLPGKPVSLTATARHNQNSSTGRVDLVVPSIGINVSRFELPLSRLLDPDAVTSKWYDRIGVTYALKTEQKISGTDSTLFEEGLAGLLERAVAGVRHTATASTQIKAGFVSLTPNVSYNGYWNFAALDKAVSPDVPDSVVTDTLRGFYADGDWRLGLSANTKFYGTFNNRGEGRLRALRHVITPQVGFSYNPAFQRQDTVLGLDGSVLEVFNPLAPGLYTPAELGARGALNFTLNNNLEAKIRDKDGETRKVRLIDNLSLRASHNLQADSLRWSDITGSGFTTLAGKFPVNIGFAHSIYDRDSSGTTIDRYLWEGGGPPLRLKRMNASVNANWSGQGKVPWSVRTGYTMRLQRSWRQDLQADTTILTQNVTFNGDVTLFEDWRVTIGSGYDFMLKDFTNTQVNLLWDLHCWEFSARWIPFGIQKSLQLRLAVKASMLRDVKLEKRFQGSGLIR